MFGIVVQFDPYLDQVDASTLKSMVRLWGGKSNLRREVCATIIREGLASPERVRQALSGLHEHELLALWLLKQWGNRADPRAFALAVAASGVPLPTVPTVRTGSVIDGLMDALAHRGLVMEGRLTNANHPRYSNVVYFSDERLLAEVRPQLLPALRLPPAVVPPASAWRRPQSVTLTVISLMQALAAAGGLALTKAGAVRTTEMRKLDKAMGWGDVVILDGLEFPEPAVAFIGALRQMGLVTVSGDRLVVAEPGAQFSGRPYHVQARSLALAFTEITGWREWAGRNWHMDSGNTYGYGRVALLTALARLPDQDNEFHSFDSLDEALFAAIGEDFSLGYRSHRPYHFRQTPEEIRLVEAEWRAKLRSQWLGQERLWLQSSLCTWLYALGMVEIGLAEGRPVSFRITPLGRAAMHPESADDLPVALVSDEPAWVVQPNFDLLVYLDRAVPAQLAFVERVAARLQAQQHTAHYRITRDSVYGALEAGVAMDELLDGLRKGAAADLPQNVAAEIREWAGLRERMTLRRRVSLLEFAQEKGRQDALDAGLPGSPVGDRFMLVTTEDLRGIHSRGRTAQWLARRVDYKHPLPRCLSANETGVVTLRSTAPDLLIRSQMAHWAEPTSDTTWQLTQTQVAATVRAGRPARELLTLLNERLQKPLPEMLEIALRAWGRESLKVDLASVVALRCSNAEVLKAITSSHVLKPWLLGALGPDVLLVDPEHEAELREHLAWAGLTIVPQVEVRS